MDHLPLGKWAFAVKITFYRFDRFFPPLDDGDAITLSFIGTSKNGIFERAFVDEANGKFMSLRQSLTVTSIGHPLPFPSHRRVSVQNMRMPTASRWIIPQGPTIQPLAKSRQIRFSGLSGRLQTAFRSKTQNQLCMRIHFVIDFKTRNSRRWCERERWSCDKAKNPFGF